MFFDDLRKLIALKERDQAEPVTYGLSQLRTTVAVTTLRANPPYVLGTSLPAARTRLQKH